ncbi:MAG: O-antigen ligase family protein [Chitinophagales bacterium]|nr:O-antigen ligase family protein [Chitinophagales bacterium]
MFPNTGPEISSDSAGNKQPLDKFWLRLLYAFSGLMLVCGFAAIYAENYLLLLIPCGILFLYLSLNDFRVIYFLLLFLLPLSTEVALPGGFATDFPTEPLIAGLMILFFCTVAARPATLDKEVLKNPVIFLLILHYCWILIATVYSADPLVSVKFSIAKTWYIITFVFVTGMIIKDVSTFKIAFWCVLIPLLFTVIYSLVRHSRYDFSFQTVNEQMIPFFRNHVNYACTLAQMMPFVVLAIGWYRKGSVARRFLLFSFALLLVAIYFAYTRSAWLSLLGACCMYFVIRSKLTGWLLAAGMAGLVGLLVYMSVQNHYLNFEPDFEHTIYHPELEDHLLSTFEGEDVSSAERVYRWIAGIRMWLDKPVIGYGPGNFYGFYKSFTVTSFKTYVSENPERSSVHNYFILLMTEQGIIGLLIFLALTIVLLTQGQRIYHETTDRAERRYVMAVLLCLVIIYMNTMLSDLIETDKIGSFFFICIALIVNQDIRNNRLKQQQQQIPLK